MAKDTEKGDKLVPISEAARFLGISIATVRRWDKQGILHSDRQGGRYRYFSLEELEQVKFSQPLEISEAAERLGVSATTLRRLEEEGLIQPERSPAGERLYTKEVLEKFINSEYWLSRKKVQEKVLEPFAAGNPLDAGAPVAVGGEGDPRHAETHLEHQVLGAAIQENQEILEHTQEDVHKFAHFRQALSRSGLALVMFFVLLIASITAFFLLYPEDTAKFFGWYRPHNGSGLAFHETIGQGRVLGIQENSNTWGRPLRPFGRLALGLVRIINKESYERAVAALPLEDVNEMVTVNEEGDLVVLNKLVLPASSYLKFPDSGLIPNLNAELIQGRVPGTEPGNLLVTNEAGKLALPGPIVTESVITQSIADGAITADKLAPGVAIGGEIVLTDDSVLTQHIKNGEVAGSDVADGAISGLKISDGAVGTSEIAAEAITSALIADASLTTLDILDGTIANADIASEAAISDSKLGQITSANKVAGSAIQLASGGGLINNSGLSLVQSCAADQVLSWNGSSWGCGTITSGAGDITTVLAGSGLVGGGASGDVTLNIGTGTGITVGTDDISINQAFMPTWTGLHTFSSGLISSGLTVSSGTVSLPAGEIGNTELANSSLTISAGTGLSGGGGVSLGGSTNLAIDQTFSPTWTGVHTFTGNLTADDSSADTISIGQSGATDDTVTIAGNLSLTDDQWSISAAGVVSGLSGTLGGLTVGGASDLTCTNCIGGTEIDESSLNLSVPWSSLAAPASNLSLTTAEYSTALNWNTAAVAGAVDGLALAVTNDATVDVTTQRVAVISNALAVGGGTTERLLVLDNADDGAVTTALEIVGSATGGVTTAIDVADAEIGTALAIGSNDVMVGGITLSSSEFALLDSGITLGELTDAGTLTATTTAFTTLSVTGNTTLGDGASDTLAINAGSSGSGIDFGSSTFNSCTSLETNGSGVLVCGTDDTGSATAFDAVADPTGNGAVVMAETAQTMDWNTNNITALAFDGLAVTITNDAATDILTQNAFRIDNLNDGGSTGTTESLLVIDNSDTNEAVTNAIEFINAGGGFTNLFNVAGTLISSTEFTLLDSGIALSELTDSGTLTATTAVLGALSTDTLTLTNTGTLNGLDAIDSTSETTLEAALDTLANVTSIQGQTVTIAGTTTLSGTNTGDQTSVSGNAGTVTFADAASDTTTFVALGTSATGSLAPASDSGLTYNASTDALTIAGALSASNFSGTSSGTNTGDQTLASLGGANTALSNLSGVAINTALVLGTSDSAALGSATKMWSDLFLADGAVINFNNGDVTATHSADTLTFAGGTVALGTATASGGLTVTGATSLGDNSATVAINSSDWDIDSTGVITGVSLDANGSGNSITNIETADIANGTLDADDLDQATEDGAPADGECLKFETSGGGDFLWGSCGAGGTTFDAIGDPAGNGAIAMAETVQTLDWNTNNITASVFDGLSVTVTNDAATDILTQNVFRIDNLNDGGATGTTESLLVIDNSDTNEAVTNAIEFVNAGGGFTNLFNVAGTLISSTEFILLDSGVALSELTDSGTLTATTVDINGGAVDGTTIGATSASTGAFTTLSSTGVTTIGNNSATVAINSPDWDIDATGTITGISLDANGSGNSITNIETADIANGTLDADDLDQATEDGAPADGECLKFETSGGGDFLWGSCGAASGSLDDAYNNGATITVDATDILFDLNDATNDYGLVIDNNTAGAIAIGLEFTSGGGGALTTAIDASATAIGTALSVGANDIVGSTGLINYDNFDVDASGNLDIAGRLTAGSGDEVITLATGKIDADALTLTAAADGGSGTSSGSGLIARSDGIGLLQGCSDGQVLKWVESTDTWDCAADATGGSSVPNMNAFTDTTTESIVDADTTNYWDGTAPNITPSASSSEILVMMSATITATSATDTQVSAQILRHTSAITCQTTGTAVGGQVGIFQGFTAGGQNMAKIFVDNPATTSNVQYTLCSEADTEAAVGTMARIDFTLYEINDNADLAEVYPTNDGGVHQGDVVSVDSDLLAGVRRSLGAYDKNVLGVVSTQPALVIGSGKGGTNGVPIALSGRVPVKVSAENGPIRAGDVLTSSSTPGVAMKATKAGAMIGIALEDNQADRNTVMTFVKTGHYNGANLKEILEDQREITADNIGQLTLSHFIQQKEQAAATLDLSEIITDRLAAAVEVVTPRLTAQEGIFTGTLTADRIRANHIEGLEELTGRLDELTGKVAGLQDRSAMIEPSPTPAVDLSVLDSLEINGALTIAGSAEFKGRPVFNNDTAGFARLAKGTQRVDVTFSQAYESTPIVNATMALESSPEADQAVLEEAILQAGYSYIVSRRAPTGFSIVLNRPAQEDLSFSWAALAVREAKTFEAFEAPEPTPLPSAEPSPEASPTPLGV